MPHSCLLLSSDLYGALLHSAVFDTAERKTPLDAPARLAPIPERGNQAILRSVLWGVAATARKLLSKDPNEEGAPDRLAPDTAAESAR